MKPQDEDLDSLIDTAARGMVSREPGRAFTYGVMARVGERGPRVRGRLVWAAGTAVAAALCAVTAIVVVNRTPLPSPNETRAVELDIIRGGVERELPPAAEPVPAPPRPRVARSIVTQPPAMLAEPAPAIEPLVPEPIALSPIDVMPLEHPPAAIDVIEIDDLTIPLLTVSND